MKNELESIILGDDDLDEAIIKIKQFKHKIFTTTYKNCSKIIQLCSKYKIIDTQLGSDYYKEGLQVAVIEMHSKHDLDWVLICIRRTGIDTELLIVYTETSYEDIVKTIKDAVFKQFMEA